MHRPHPLLQHAIDYAGLYPPAALAMTDAVEEYAGSVRSDDAWALGRFVVPAQRLPELWEVVEPRAVDGPSRWRLAATGSGAVERDGAAISEIEARAAGRLRVEAYETRSDDLARLREVLRAVPASRERFLEIPLALEPDPMLHAIREGKAAAKFRTGGVTPDAFPEPDHLLRGLDAAVRHRVPFKCTAGLHHPVRGRYRLTYAGDSALGTMYGYLNVLLAAAGLVAGWPEADVRAVLLEESPTGFTLEPDGGVAWRGRRLCREVVTAFRRNGMVGFGSCSFRDPMDELAEVPVG